MDVLVFQIFTSIVAGNTTFAIKQASIRGEYGSDMESRYLGGLLTAFFANVFRKNPPLVAFPPSVGGDGPELGCLGGDFTILPKRLDFMNKVCQHSNILDDTGLHIYYCSLCGECYCKHRVDLDNRVWYCPKGGHHITTPDPGY